jgi:hypothetical protein
MMIAVAGLALVLELGSDLQTIYCRWKYASASAAMHRKSAKTLREAAHSWQEIPSSCFLQPPTRISPARRQQMLLTAKHFDREAQRFEHAARYSWLPLVPEARELK